MMLYIEHNNYNKFVRGQLCRKRCVNNVLDMRITRRFCNNMLPR